MTNVIDLSILMLGFAAMFFCVGFGMVFLRKPAEGQVGLGYWAASFFLNSVGFFLAGGIFQAKPWQFFTNGIALQMLGFYALALGTYRFTGNEFRRWNIYALGGVTVGWLGAMVLMKHSLVGGYSLLLATQATVFLWTGTLILRHISTKSLAGHRLAGWGLVIWGVYSLLFPLIFQFPRFVPLAYGFLVGLHVLASVGMVTMALDRIRIRAEASESHAQRLEGLLPICASCKKIRDDQNNWQNIESYVSRRSKAEFSHSICPECTKKHYPDFDIYNKSK